MSLFGRLSRYCRRLARSPNMLGPVVMGEPLKASKPFDPHTSPPLADPLTAEVLRRWRAWRQNCPDLTWSRFLAELQRQDRDLAQTIAALERELAEQVNVPRFTP